MVRDISELFMISGRLKDREKVALKSVTSAVVRTARLNSWFKWRIIPVNGYHANQRSIFHTLASNYESAFNYGLSSEKVDFLMKLAMHGLIQDPLETSVLGGVSSHNQGLFDNCENVIIQYNIAITN